MQSAAHPKTYEAALTEIRRLRTYTSDLEEKLAGLSYELAQMKRIIFGVRSERYEPSMPDQMALFQSEEPVASPPVRTTSYRTETATRRKPVRQVLPTHLPRETIVIEPEVDTTGLKKIGAEVTETLDYRPPKITVVRRERPKYVDPSNESRGVIIAPLPARPVDKGIAEPSLLAHVTIEKYVDHMPIYRQVQRFTREGITLSASTMGDWIRQTADLLAPLYEKLALEARASGYIQADETPIAVQDTDQKGSTHRGWYWVYHAPEPGIVVMDYRKSRGRDGPIDWLAGYEGLIQADGYHAYDELEKNPGIHVAGCWAHARRKFFDAQGSSPDRAEHALREIRRLYDIERTLREAGASPEERERVRCEQAPPILEAFRTWLENNPGLPRSPWGTAVRYALARWPKLTAYLSNGRLEIDNNLVENAIRPIALGRKNYLFAGSHDAAQRAAVVYSLLATCKKHDVNPYLWLSDVLARIPTHPAKSVGELLPHHWKNVQR